ncbi:unnamed protein product, partial [Ectocarpus sp. 12 AP-2014]
AHLEHVSQGQEARQGVRHGPLPQQHAKLDALDIALAAARTSATPSSGCWRTYRSCRPCGEACWDGDLARTSTEARAEGAVGRCFCLADDVLSLRALVNVRVIHLWSA